MTIAWGSGSAASTYTSVYDNAVSTPGNSTNPSTSFTVQDGAIWFGGVGNGATTWNPSARSGTQINDWDAGSRGRGAQYGIKSGTGSQTVSWTFGTSEDWIIQAISFKESPLAQALTPTLATNSNSFFAPTVSTGAVALTPGLYTNTQSFYSPVVDQPIAGQDLTPSLYTNTNTLYEPSVSVGSVGLTPSLFSNSQTIYTPVVSVGGVTLTPSLYSNTQDFYTHSLSQSSGGQEITPPLYTNSQTFYNASVLVGAVSLAPSLYTNEQTFYTPVTTVGAVNLTAGLLSNSSTFYTHTLDNESIISNPIRKNVRHRKQLSFLGSKSLGRTRYL